MKNLNQTLTRFLHRYPWAVQVGLASTIALIALVSTGQFQNWAKAATGDFINVTKPVAGETWVVGSRQELKLTLGQATASTTVSFRLCQNNPGICYTEDIITPLNLSGAAGTTLTAVWERVGYDLTGKLLVSGDAYLNNAVITVVVDQSDIVLPAGTSFESPIFSIVEPGLDAIQSPNSFDHSSFYVNDDTNQAGVVIGNYPINPSESAYIVVGASDTPEYQIGTIVGSGTNLGDGRRSWNFIFNSTPIGDRDWLDIIRQYNHFGITKSLTDFSTLLWSSDINAATPDDNIGVWPGVRMIVIDGRTDKKIFNNLDQPQTGYIVGRGLSKLGIGGDKRMAIFADHFTSSDASNGTPIAFSTTRRISVFPPGNASSEEAWEFTIPANTQFATPVGTYSHFSVVAGSAPDVSKLVVMQSYTVNSNSTEDDVEIVSDIPAVETPVITAVAPTNPRINTVVTITGSNFGTASETSKVEFIQAGQATQASLIQSWTDTAILAAVPTNLSAGSATVAVTTSVGTSNAFSITIAGSPAAATYYSQKVTQGLAVGNIGPIKFDSFQSNFSQAATGSDVDFAIGFFDANDQLIYSRAEDGSDFDSEGYYMIPEADEYQLATGFSLPTTLFGQNSKASRVRSIRFRIAMSSADITVASQPWVSDVALNFTASDGSAIGIINFTDVPTNSKVIKTIARGQTGSFALNVTPASFTGNAILNIGPITKVGSAEAVTDITAQFSANPISLAEGAVDLSLQITVSDNSSLSGLYQFDVFGHDTANENSVLAPAVGIGQINIPATTGPFSLTISPTTNAVVRGATTPTTFVITATRISSFTGTINLTSNISSIFGADVASAFNPTAITFSASDVAVPGGPILSKTSTLTVNANNSATLTDLKTFTVNGAVSGQVDQIATAQLSILDAADAITLNLTIPVEGGKPTDATWAHPRFTLRLYKGLVKTLEKTGLVTNAQNQVALVVTHTELPAGTYTAYVRSTRHLWGKSTEATIVITDTTTTKTLTFPTLKVGDLDINNKVNMQDLNIDQTWSKYGQTASGLLGDFNNDGKINIGDISFITNFNYGKWGDQLPDEAR